jgi:hypothetical protein
MGASWRTSLVGYISIASGVVGFIADLLVTQGLPSSLPEYVVFAGLVLGGIGHILAKDANVSNSGTNAPVHTVSKS